MSKETILVIEDEDSIRELIVYNLTKNGYEQVRGVDSGESGLLEIKKSPPDLILLDLMLPGMDGLSFCRKLKADPSTARIPVIMLTAKGEESDIIVGLEIGADDYIVKPFSPRVLIARIHSLLRRCAAAAGEENLLEDSDGGNSAQQVSSRAGILKRGALMMNRGMRIVRLEDRELNLTFSEFEILYLLAKRPGWVYTRNQIVNAVKGEDYPVTERAVDVQIVSLRRKLGASADLIETVRGVGYRFNADVSSASSSVLH